MTVTLKLPPKMAERAKEIANERDTDVDTLLLEAFAEYLQEQEDIAYATERLALIKSGEAETISLEEMEARLFGGEG